MRPRLAESRHTTLGEDDLAQTGPTSIANLELTWRSIDELCSDLTDAEWATPTGCPGWTVQDQVAHLVDYEARALGRPGPDHVAVDVSHTKNALGASNEHGIDFRRARRGSEVLAEYREVVAERGAQLHALTPEELDREIVTPAGPGTLHDMLTLRVMDTWSHEQDIRRALDRPGHEAGPVAAESVTYFSRFLPLIVGKRVAPPEGTGVVFAIGDVDPIRIAVVDGRAAIVDALPGEPAVELTMSAPAFAALVGGRSDAPADVRVDGDADLGAAVVAALGFLP